MRHGKKINHLSRTTSHRKAMLANMASSLILNKRISTTVAKAKALRKYVEPLLTKAKDDTTHSRRVVFSYLNEKEAVKILFDEVAEKIASRPGGYTRIIKTGARLGDNAEMCIMELVDYNELLLKDAKPAKTKKRSRRGGSKKKSDQAAGTAAAATQVEEAVEVTDQIEEAVVEETTEAPEATTDVETVTEETVAEAEEVVEAPVDEEAPEVEAAPAEEVKAETAEESPKNEEEADKNDADDSEEENKEEK